MARVLRDLLGVEDPLFLPAFEKLEAATGNQAIDARLIGEIVQLSRDTVSALRLDHGSSTAEEIYYALNAYVDHGKSLDIFQATQYVIGQYGDQAVSFNQDDIMENARFHRPFEERTLESGRQALRQEIATRYTRSATSRPVVQRIINEANLLPEGEVPIMIDEGKKAPYILAIGDIFTDAFIKLNEEVARVDVDDNGDKRLSLPLGSKPPYDQVDIVQAVGPAPNAAVAIARLGLTSGLDSFIGDDQVGVEAIDYLKGEGIDTSTMLIEKGIKTSYYFVLRYGAERTILVKNEQFNYTWTPPAEEPEWIYLALISDDSWQFHEGLLAYLEQHPNVKLAFQPGTFHFKWGVEKLAGIYRRTHILVLNREEAVDITGRSYDSIRELANGLHDLGPQKVVITDGPNGSYASYDFKLVTIPNYPDPGPPVDRTGAGDAFASTIVGALALGESMDTALTWAPINSMNVVQHLGAQAGLLSREAIEALLAQAPDYYKLTDYEG